MTNPLFISITDAQGRIKKEVPTGSADDPANPGRTINPICLTVQDGRLLLLELRFSNLNSPTHIKFVIREILPSGAIKTLISEEIADFTWLGSRDGSVPPGSGTPRDFMSNAKWVEIGNDGSWTVYDNSSTKEIQYWRKVPGQPVQHARLTGDAVSGEADGATPLYRWATGLVKLGPYFYMTSGYAPTGNGNTDGYSIKRIASDGSCITWCGAPPTATDRKGNVDGDAASSRFYNIWQFFLGADGNFYVVDELESGAGYRLVKVSVSTGSTTTIAVVPQTVYSYVVDSTGTIYYISTDEWSGTAQNQTGIASVLKRITPDGTITKLVGGASTSKWTYRWVAEAIAPNDGTGTEPAFSGIYVDYSGGGIVSWNGKVYWIHNTWQSNAVPDPLMHRADFAIRSYDPNTQTVSTVIPGLNVIDWTPYNSNDTLDAGKTYQWANDSVSKHLQPVPTNIQPVIANPVKVKVHKGKLFVLSTYPVTGFSSSIKEIDPFTGSVTTVGFNYDSNYYGGLGPNGSWAALGYGRYCITPSNSNPIHGYFGPGSWITDTGNTSSPFNRTYRYLQVDTETQWTTGTVSSAEMDEHGNVYFIETVGATTSLIGYLPYFGRYPYTLPAPITSSATLYCGAHNNNMYVLDNKKIYRFDKLGVAPNDGNGNPAATMDLVLTSPIDLGPFCVRADGTVFALVANTGGDFTSIVKFVPGSSTPVTIIADGVLIPWGDSINPAWAVDRPGSFPFIQAIECLGADLYIISGMSVIKFDGATNTFVDITTSSLGNLNTTSDPQFRALGLDTTYRLDYPGGPKLRLKNALAPYDGQFSIDWTYASEGLLQVDLNTVNNA